jgi:SAM-dependent methyltransferase
MDPAPGAGTFQTSGAAYDSFMGRYSSRLAVGFADFSGVVAGSTALDVGCGPGALTRVLVERLGAEAVAAVDPSDPFVVDCSAACPGVDIRLGRAEAIPFDNDRFDAALTQLVLHFVSDPTAAARELRRVVRPGGTVAACVWDVESGMQMLRHFWDAAATVDSSAPQETQLMKFGRPGEIVDLFDKGGLHDLTETTLDAVSSYSGFDELWSGFLAGIGPAGSYCVSLDDDRRAAVRRELFDRVGSPAGAFELRATARAARGRVPR